MIYNIIKIVLFSLTVTAISNTAFAQMSREEYRQQLEAYRQTSKQNEAIFLDKTQATDKRLEAGKNIELFSNPENMAACLDIVMDVGQADAIRAAGLMKVRHAAHKKEEVRNKILNWMGQASTPPQFRRTCMDVMQMAYMNPNTPEKVKADVTTVFHKIMLDADPAARERAFYILSAHDDGEAQWLLARGLQEPAQALLPAEKSIPLLALRTNRSDYYLNLIHNTLLKTSNEAVEIECVKVLGNYEPAVSDLIGLLNNEKKALQLRQLCMSGLNQGLGESFLSITEPIITDEYAPESLRVYALQAATYRALNRKTNIVNADSPMDKAFEQVIEKVKNSSSEAVRRTVGECCRKLKRE